MGRAHQRCFWKISPRAFAWLRKRFSRLQREVFFELLHAYMMTPERTTINGEILDFGDGDCLYSPKEITDEMGEKRTTVLTCLEELERKGLISKREKRRDKEGRWTCFIVDWEIIFTEKGRWGWRNKGVFEPEPKWAAQLAEERAKAKKISDDGDDAPPDAATGSPSGGGDPPSGPAPGDDDGPHGPDVRRTGARKAAAASHADGNKTGIIETFPAPSEPQGKPGPDRHRGPQLEPASSHPTFRSLSGEQLYELGRQYAGLSGDRKAWIEAKAADKYKKLRAWLYEHSSSGRDEIDQLTRLVIFRHPATKKRLREWVIKPLNPDAALAAARGQANVLKISEAKGGRR